eukprot:IDg11459t1
MYLSLGPCHGARSQSKEATEQLARLYLSPCKPWIEKCQSGLQDNGSFGSRLLHRKVAWQSGERCRCEAGLGKCPWGVVVARSAASPLGDGVVSAGSESAQQGSKPLG